MLLVLPGISGVCSDVESSADSNCTMISDSWKRSERKNLGAGNDEYSRSWLREPSASDKRFQTYFISLTALQLNLKHEQVEAGCSHGPGHDLPMKLEA